MTDPHIPTPQKVFNFRAFLITGAYTGYSPCMAGTIGSAFVVVFFSLAVVCLPFVVVQVLYGILTLAAIIIGFSLCEYAEKDLFKISDPQFMVIDEMAGMGIALLPLVAQPPEVVGSLHYAIYVLTAFGFFRLFDIVKPGWIGRLNQQKGSRYIMLDDIAAGVITAFLLLVIMSL